MIQHVLDWFPVTSLFNNLASQGESDAAGKVCSPRKADSQNSDKLLESVSQAFMGTNVNLRTGDSLVWSGMKTMMGAIEQPSTPMTNQPHLREKRIPSLALVRLMCQWWCPLHLWSMRLTDGDWLEVGVLPSALVGFPEMLLRWLLQRVLLKAPSSQKVKSTKIMPSGTSALSWIVFVYW